MDFLVSDSIRCWPEEGGYLGSDQGESGDQGIRGKNAGLNSATLISVSSPVSQVLW